jgi:hypothetical protein
MYIYYPQITKNEKNCTSNFHFYQLRVTSPMYRLLITNPTDPNFHFPDNATVCLSSNMTFNNPTLELM